MEIILENLKPTRRGHFRLLPNINVSGRILPSEVSPEDLTSNNKLDNERATRKLRDKEIYSVVIDINQEEWDEHTNLTLEATFDTGVFRMFNQSGLPITSHERQPIKVDLQAARKESTKARGIQYFLEAQTFWGSPLVSNEANPTVSFRILDGDTVLLSQNKWHNNDIRTADIILLGDSAPPERIFMCELEQNQPSVRELSVGAKAAGVPLTLIPVEVGMGDTWLQDQFQVGYTGTPEGSQRVIVHLPRMVNDSAIVPGTPNLRNFTDSYFPSESIGVVKDFWWLKITIKDGIAPDLPLEVAKTYSLYKQLALIIRLLRAVASLILEIDGKNPELRFSISDLYRVRLAIDSLQTKLLRYKNLKAEQSTKVQSIKPILDALSKVLDRQGDRVILTVTVDGRSQKFIYDSQNSNFLEELFVSLFNIHSSRNFGGNIEVSPPCSSAIYGKILAGSITSQEIRNFLTSRGTAHLLVMVYTGWLEVGHIDEIAIFAPNPDGGFCILRASPRLAVDMLERLKAAQARGVRVTRFFRGKKWVHESAGGATDPHLPPNTFRRMIKPGIYDLSGFDQKIPKNAEPTFGDAVYHDDRQFLVFNKRNNANARYAAMISCADLLTICWETNRTVEDLFLSRSYAYSGFIGYAAYYDDDAYRSEAEPFRLDKVLSREFSGVSIYPLPVLFDWATDLLNNQTSAIMPDVVNFQTLGKHVLVPRPCGARMPVADAVNFITDLLAKWRYPKTSIDERYIRSRGLDKTWYWTSASERVNRAEIANIPTDFDPDFEELMRSKANTMYAENLQNAGMEAISPLPVLDFYALQHAGDPLTNHPVSEPETLYRIAGYFKDGFEQFTNFPVDYCEGDTEDSHPKFDQYETDIKDVMKKIKDANPGVFDQNGNITSKNWIRISIPEDTVDVFELYTQVLMESLGLEVHWVDSWYYHTHMGGVHCGTNVLRIFKDEWGTLQGNLG